MKALVSGQAGVAILMEGNEIFSLSFDAPERVARSSSEISYLLAGAADVIELGDITEDEAAAALDIAWRKDRTLHLSLILLNGEADPEARRIAAESLEGLLANPQVADFVYNRLYCSPLPELADLLGALRRAEKYRSLRLKGLLEELGAYQPEIQLVRKAWDVLPGELFDKTSTKQEFFYVAVTSGAFRRFVQAD